MSTKNIEDFYDGHSSIDVMLSEKNLYQDQIALRKLTQRIIYVSALTQEGHIPSSLSVLDIIYYFYKYVYSLSASKSLKSNFILSKGHASLGLYAVLEYLNLLDGLNLDDFCKRGSRLGGHPDKNKLKEVKVSTGSLGHGLPIAIGIAAANKFEKKAIKTITLIGDGECNEGSIWESAMIASKFELKNLVCIVDNNKSSDRAIKITNFSERFQAFGWKTLQINGHDPFSILSALNYKHDENCPLFIEALTTKGYGVFEMENNPEWHHKSPDMNTISTFTITR